MSDYLNLIGNVLETYKNWVSQNPQTVSDLETSVKFISYFVAGRVSNSSVVTELIYALSNILMLCNDRIIEKTYPLAPITDGFLHQVKLMITALEYSEVFIEISAKKMWGQKGRWLFITIVQVLKTIGRFFLMKRLPETITQSPPIPPLDRKLLHQQLIDGTQNALIPTDNVYTFKLKRSGRIVRKVEGAPPFHLRNFGPIQSPSNLQINEVPSILKTAEGFYIAKPLVHLGAIGLFGYKSWKSYTVAILLDLASIRMYHKNQHLLTKKQRVDLSKRCINLLLYLVRSPFYEKTSEKRIAALVRSIANTIPFANTICKPILQYIPQWQNTYFYMWST